MISRDAHGHAGPPPGAVEALPEVERHLAAFYDRIEACFGEAAGAGGGPIVVDHRIAGRTVRLRFAHHRLRAVVGRALQHLSIPTGGPDPMLTISLWDSRSSGVAMPRPPWSLRDYTHRGEIRGHGTRRFRTSFHLHSGIFNMADLETGRAVYWTRDAAAIPSYASSMPLLPILHWWTARFGMQLVHAGAVGTPRAAALLAGEGGAGKSTTALACLADGLHYVSDDYCLIQPDPAPRAHSVFCSARLHPRDMARLPFVRPLVSNPSELASDKALVFLRDAFPARLAAELPVRVVLLPRVGTQRVTTSEPAPRAAAHRALTNVTLHNLPGAGAAAIETIARTVKQLPCYYLNLGSDRETVPAAIRAILEETT